MDSHESRSHCSHATSPKDPFLVLSVHYVHSTAGGVHICWKCGLTVWDDWTEHSAALASEEEERSQSTWC